MSHLIEGLSQAESDAMLEELYAYTEAPEIRYTHKWRPGDLLMWDNTITLHRAQPYPIGCARASMRVPLAGEERVPA